MASVLFSRTTISPPGPSSGAPETAKRPAVQRGGLGAACAIGASAVTKVAASANSRSFEPIDISVSPRAVAARIAWTGAPAPVDWAKCLRPPGRGGILSSPPPSGGRSEGHGTMFTTAVGNGSQHGPYARDAGADHAGRNARLPPAACAGQDRRP